MRKIRWASRSALHVAVADTTSLGWTERLGPMLATLRAGVAPDDYSMPAQSSAAAVDLVLAVLDEHMDSAAAVSSLPPDNCGGLAELN